MRAKYIRTLAALAAGVATVWSVTAAEGWTRYNFKAGKGNVVAIEGTSTIHDWRVEGSIIGGYFEAGPGFPTNAAAAKPGKVEAKAEAFIPVRSLKSVENGKPHSTQMDNIVYEKLLEPTNKQIKFSLKEMTLKEAPAAGKPFVFETKGDLTVAGATKSVTMPVEMTVGDKELTFKGEVAAKFTDFKVEPVSAMGGTIKTGDDLKLSINWMTRTR